MLILNLQINALTPNSFVYIHSVTQYGIFSFGGGEGGNSSKSGNIFTLQKKIFRIIVGTKLRAPCISILKIRDFYLFHDNVSFQELTLIVLMWRIG